MTYQLNIFVHCAGVLCVQHHTLYITGSVRITAFDVALKLVQNHCCIIGMHLVSC